MAKKRNLKKALITAVLVVAIWSVAAVGGTIYVDADTSPGGNGQSWGTAYKYLQDALYKPPTGGDEIWVAEGTYKPDANSSNPPSVEDLVTTGLSNPRGIALDVAAGKMYWTDVTDGNIYDANMDGTGSVEDLVTGLSQPVGIALDVAAGKMYWTDYQAWKIQRANMDGSNVEDLVTGLSSPKGIALDVAAGKMYWTDAGTDKIQRANLDGSSVEDLVTTGLTGPDGIALDVAAGKMYWADSWTNKITRANMNGSSIEDLVTTGLIDPSGIALDVAGGKMYWTDYQAWKIQRANMDGSNVEDLVTGLSSPKGIALDVANGKMYWTDSGSDKIQRANMFGGGSGLRTETFQLISGVGIYGGFPTGGGTWEQRNPSAYETILSGDINTPDDANDNSYHVVTGSLTDATAIIDGFTITAGNADGSYPYNHRGGGLYNDEGSPTVINCTFSGNSARTLGGGMSNWDYSIPTVTNCLFSGNSAGNGGGMHNEESSPTLTNCTFSGNSAGDGGGMYNYNSGVPLQLTNCIFTGNRASDDGGAMHNDGCIFGPTLTNCIFTGNLATNDGGGMYNNNSDPNATNCTFAGNYASCGKALACDSTSIFISHVQLTNSILWDGGGEICNRDGSTITINYSDIQGWSVPGGNNISANPMFVDADNPDPNLRDYHLRPGSPCIDAGDNTAVPGGVTTDLDGKPRFFDDPGIPDTGYGTPPIVDMGAYERQTTTCKLTIGSGPNGSVTTPGQGLFYYDYGEVVSIVAVPNVDCYFVEWTGTAVVAGKVADPCAASTTVTMHGDYTLVANFDTYTLTVSSTSGGSVTTPGEGVFYYDHEEVVSIVAEPNAHYHFVEWTGSAVSAGKVADPYAATTTVTVDADYTLVANFARTTIYVDVNATGTNDGWSWADAYNNLQDGLAAAGYGSNILVAAGIYKPDILSDIVIEDLVTTGLTNPSGIALDVNAGKMYWTDYDTDKITRANLDGSNVEDLVTTGLSIPRGIALDVAGGKMYWTDAGTADKIQRANMDGSGVEDLVTGLSYPYGIALDVAAGKMYWIDYLTDKIRRANMSDGSSVEDLVTTGLISSAGIALDVAGGKMYWTDSGTNKIQRANMSDGSSVEDLVITGLNTPAGIALDVAGGKMYWTDAGTDKIQRANMSDGSNVEDLVTTGLNSPYGIALDVAAGKMYWTDSGTNKIQRANMFGGDSGLRTETFQLINGVAIYGGFAGCGAPDPYQRNIQLYQTILSGDLDGNDVQGLDPCDLLDHPSRAENSYHVVTGTLTDATAVLDGFTITAGNANGSTPYDVGGGMYNEDSNAVVIGCTFTKNSADRGGGMLNFGSSPTLTNCTFSGNSAGIQGGGMYCGSSDANVTNCTFSGNNANFGGGIFYHPTATAIMTNCTFSGNTATNDGGGMSGGSLRYVNCMNCILWGNSDSGGTDESAQIHWSGGPGGRPSVNYCCVQGWTGGLGGTGNIDDDPLFVDPNGLDDIAGTQDDDLHLVPGFPGSPCINTGDPWGENYIGLVDIDGDPRVSDGRVDMGSDEVIWDGAENVSPSDPPVTLNPGGGENDPNEEALVVFDNNSVGDANITVVEMSNGPNPAGGLFEVLGSTLRIDTTLSDGEFFMTVMIPFDANDLAGKDPCTVDLMYYDAVSEAWMLAVAGNTGPVGTRWVEVATSDPAPTLSTLTSRSLGDYGVYWNGSTGKGFVWANVDHSTDFSAAGHGIPDFEPDGDVDLVDFAFFAQWWQETGCGICGSADLTGDGNVDYYDLKELTNNWLAGL